MSTRTNQERQTCVRIEKRERWVEYLKKREHDTKKEVYNDRDKIRMNNTRFTRKEVLQNIRKIIIEPNPKWLKLKQEKYTWKKSFFEC